MQAAPRTSEESGWRNARSKAVEAQRESPHSFVKNLLQRGRITQYAGIYYCAAKATSRDILPEGSGKTKIT
ncbi:hypothetical protein SAMN04488557_0823 [Hyphomicrobium facile]|uniref:Uncharacterized protein n=1 Tax=Hyphomicrobium facile TaxID=51670 RepID=A0A1I7MZ61_9HYPH|nr:hypothetical protein SAMN04488557_0823 [Hyphomicrobium facile]